MVDPLTIAALPKRPKAYHDVEGELSTFVHATVIVKPDGEVILNKQKNLQNRKSAKKNK